MKQQPHLRRMLLVLTQAPHSDTPDGDLFLFGSTQRSGNSFDSVRTFVFISRIRQSKKANNLPWKELR